MPSEGRNKITESDKMNDKMEISTDSLLPPSQSEGRSPTRYRRNLAHKEGDYTYEIVYDRDTVESTFAMLLVLVIVGEFFSAPVITLVDACTIQVRCVISDHSLPSYKLD